MSAASAVELSEDHRRKGWFVPSQSCHAVLERSVTADETWVCHNILEMKRVRVGWKRPGPPRLKNLKIVKTAGKVMANLVFGAIKVCCC